MLNIIAPITPHLAEEANNYWQGGAEDVKSVFSRPWRPVVRYSYFSSFLRSITQSAQDPKWENPLVEAEMNTLLAIRKTTLGLLEQARSAKYVFLDT